MSCDYIEMIESKNFSNSFQEGAIFLWILPECDAHEIQSIASLPWAIVWNSCSELDIEPLWAEHGDDRKIFTVDDLEQNPDFRSSEFIKHYNIVNRGNAFTDSLQERSEARRVRRLKDSLSSVYGTIVFIGNPDEEYDDILDSLSLSSNLKTVAIFPKAARDNIEKIDIGKRTLFLWNGDAQSFAASIASKVEQTTDPALVDLKDTNGIRVNEQTLDYVSGNWTLMTRALISPTQVSQDEFDAFLNGDEIWSVYASNGPFRRRAACHIRENTNEKRVDFVDEIAGRAVALDKASLDPSESLHQCLLLSEPGAGTTTLLRQTAIALARLGYPTLLTRPFSKAFGPLSIENFIIDIQDNWAKNRSGRGSGEGALPCCLIVDSDTEAAIAELGLARRLSDLGRKVLLVRALERSTDEISNSNNVYLLRADTSKSELLELGKHLREFCNKYDLVELPVESEWEAFHDGISSISRFENILGSSPNIVMPSLFLVGIYPFVKERITDENSLEQYYYRKWSELGNENAKELIKVLATAGTYQMSIPFDTLRRHPTLKLDDISAGDKVEARKIDEFVKWYRPSWNTDGWALYIRNTAIGWLLSRAINPYEGNTPYSALLPILERLTTKDEDLWFTGFLAFKLGRNFASSSPRFSLEIDTATQKAAREIFAAIPQETKKESRTVRHHEGRYHIHIIRACMSVLENPDLTTLSKDQVLRIAKDEFDEAHKILFNAIDEGGTGDSDSSIYNTLATASFSLARVLGADQSEDYKTQLTNAVDYSENSILHDPANGHALFQFVQRVLSELKSNGSWSTDEALKFYERAELRLTDLIRLNSDNRWRNIDADEAEKQIGALLQDHLQTLKQLKSIHPDILNFEVHNPESISFLRIRELLGSRTVRNVFEGNDAQQLRELREQLDQLPNKSASSLLYIYQLYLNDPEGRNLFDKRLVILEELKKTDTRQFEAYRHDEAALYCHLDKIDIGAQKFRDLREKRHLDKSQWYFFTEKTLLDDSRPPVPRELTLQVVDADSGRARFYQTQIEVRFQPRQFSDLRPKQVFRANIRFTLNGLQAVRKSQALLDYQKMGMELK